MKARKVKGLRPDMPLAEGAQRIVLVRLDELFSFVPRALDPEQDTALHDLRIAAKRLRYILEVTAPIFGAYAATAAKRAKQLQDIIGEIHDCDVQLPEVLGLLEELRAHDAAELRRAAGDAEDLDPALGAAAPNRAAYRGLDVLAVHLRARRTLLFERFIALWEKLGREHFQRKLKAALDERPGGQEPKRVSPGDGADNLADRGDGDSGDRTTGDLLADALGLPAPAPARRQG